MGLSLPHLIVLALVVLLLFGRGKISELMGDFGKGIKSFKEGVSEENPRAPAAAPPVQLTAQPMPAQPPAVAPPVAAPAVGSAPVAPSAPIAQPTLNGEPVPEHQR